MLKRDAIEILKSIQDNLEETRFLEKCAIDMGIEALHEPRPHGKWEFVGDNLFKCTHCGYMANGDYLRDWKAYTYDAEFPTACPNCGADMREGGESNE